MTDFLSGFTEPDRESKKQWAIWENYKAHDAAWGGMEHDPHDHSDALYGIPYVNAVLETYQRHVPDSAMSILEVGCAQGYILNHVGTADAYRTGIDFNEDRVRKGRAQYPDTEFIVGNVLEIDLPSRYDCILLPGILEHVGFQDARKIIDKAISACAYGGVILFDLPWWSGDEADFNSGIHMNPTHAWVATQTRWDWLFKGITVQRVHFEEYPFYVFGIIRMPHPSGVLVGCHGRIGDILHAMPAAQKIARDAGKKVHVAYSPEYSAVGKILDLLEGIASHSAMQLHYADDGLGVDRTSWPEVYNMSHTGFRPDTTKNWSIFGWWDNGFHGIDFAAANAGLELRGHDRYLHFRPGVVSDMKSNMAVFISNTHDPPMRGVPGELLDSLRQVVSDLGGMPVECSLGPICTGLDFRFLTLDYVVRFMSMARIIVSVDTLATGLLAQSVGTPILRLYTGATRDSSTGAPDRDWEWSRWETSAGHNKPPSLEKAVEHIREMWHWKI